MPRVSAEEIKKRIDAAKAKQFVGNVPQIVLTLEEKILKGDRKPYRDDFETVLDKYLDKAKDKKELVTLAEKNGFVPEGNYSQATRKEIVKFFLGLTKSYFSTEKVEEQTPISGSSPKKEKGKVSKKSDSFNYDLIANLEEVIEDLKNTAERAEKIVSIINELVEMDKEDMKNEEEEEDKEEEEERLRPAKKLTIVKSPEVVKKTKAEILSQYSDAVSSVPAEDITDFYDTLNAFEEDERTNLLSFLSRILGVNHHDLTADLSEFSIKEIKSMFISEE